MRRLVCIALLISSIAWPGAATAADDIGDLATLQARMKAATGPEPANYRQTITVRSAGETSVFHTFHLGKDWRTIGQSGQLRYAYGRFHGDDWSQNANGITTIDEPEPGADSSDDDTLTGKLTKTADAFIVTDVNVSGFGSRKTIDRQTLQLVTYERIRRAGITTTTYSEFTTFGAQTLPARSIRTREGFAPQTTTFSEYVIGDVVPVQVAMPSIRRLLVDVPGNVRTQIPARFEGSAIIVPISIAGRTFDFMLDSGASSIVLDTDVAKSLGLALTNETTIRNAGESTAYDAVVPSLSIGPVSMHDIVVSTTTLKSDPHTYGAERDKVVGLLGFDFFATLGVSIDYSNKRVFVTPATTYVPPADPKAIAIDIRLGRQVPVVSVGLDGVQADRFIVDTGNGFASYVVFDYFMDRHPNVGERSSQALDGRGVGGNFTARPITMHTFRFGTWDFKDFDGFRVGQGSYQYDTDGLIGPLFLVLFTADFDYAHGTLYLTPSINTRQMLHMR